MIQLGQDRGATQQSGKTSFATLRDTVSHCLASGKASHDTSTYIETRTITASCAKCQKLELSPRPTRAECLGANAAPYI